MRPENKSCNMLKGELHNFSFLRHYQRWVHVFLDCVRLRSILDFFSPVPHFPRSTVCTFHLFHVSCVPCFLCSVFPLFCVPCFLCSLFPLFCVSCVPCFLCYVLVFPVFHVSMFPLFCVSFVPCSFVPCFLCSVFPVFRVSCVPCFLCSAFPRSLFLHAFLFKTFFNIPRFAFPENNFDTSYMSFYLLLTFSFPVLGHWVFICLI